MKRWIIRIGIVVGILILAGITTTIVLAQMSKSTPDNLGVVDGKLNECPDSPNCVSTQTKSEKHRMEPLELSTDPQLALDQIKSIVNELGGKIVSENENYILAEFRSRIFGFVDDFECLIDEESNPAVANFRSASRVGHSDMGVNKKRVKRVCDLYKKRNQ